LLIQNEKNLTKQQKANRVIKIVKLIADFYYYFMESGCMLTKENGISYLIYWAVFGELRFKTVVLVCNQPLEAKFKGQ
jgi:hypothetical protein